MTVAENSQRAFRILITGATSTIGKRLVKRFISRGYAVVCFSRTASRVFRNVPVETIDGDITRIAEMEQAAQRCTHVINCAVTYDIRSDAMEQVNVAGARNVALAAHRAGVDRAVHISTLSVYPLTLRKRHHESDPFERVVDPYQKTKQLGEMQFRATCESFDVPWVCIRPGAMFGPESHWSPTAMASMPWYQGLGEGTIFAVYIDDVVELIEKCLTDEAAKNEVFNAVMDPPPTRLELWHAHHLQQNTTCHPNPLGAIAKIVFTPAQYFPHFRSGRAHFISMITRTRETWSASKAHTLLHWRAETGLADGARQYVEWAQCDQ